ncbi:hypothetical protein [Bdellovibrio sp. KM01]|uniref:hypothetical protein n=1 Tax=Bdellovibrio sp. KM01 TaxID=2748865 RepID=UPI0015EA5088|nr:hypothetical protein [Bdellovibrio sp. KM01]QLY26065.1 hypothetical protein HW988_03260 [Bdellovibrio sp. KM01]
MSMGLAFENFYKSLGVRMNLRLRQIFIMVGVPTLLLGYQNCAKVALSSVQDGALQAQAQPLNSPSDPASSADPEMEVIDGDDPVDITDVEIANAVKACESKEAFSAPATNLVVKYNHEVIRLDAYSVRSLSGNHGDIILRAADQSGTIESVSNTNHSTIILCGFKTIDTIKAIQDRVIVVGGEIGSLRAVHSRIALVKASAKAVKETKSIINKY